MHLHLGQGVKACPMSDIESMKAVHVSASREDIRARLRRDRQQHIDTMSPTRDIFEKTFALISALQLNGCQAPLCEPTVFSAQEEDNRSTFAFHKSRMQRGYAPLKKTCEGRLYLLYAVDLEGVPYIQWVKRSLSFWGNILICIDQMRALLKVWYTRPLCSLHRWFIRPWISWGLFQWRHTNHWANWSYCCCSRLWTLVQMYNGDKLLCAACHLPWVPINP